MMKKNIGRFEMFKIKKNQLMKKYAFNESV